LQNSTHNNMQHHYGVYGITLTSDRKIPGLDAEKIAGDSIADIHITIGTIPPDLEHLMARLSAVYFVEPGYTQGDPEHLIVRTEPGGRYYHFVYEDEVDFMIDILASSVWCRWKNSLTLEDVALYLLGPIIGFMLRLQGTTCLHASGVLVDQYALAITGASGAGKSTLAASFAAAGYPILTDDVLPLKIIDGQIHTQSGYSRLRLFPNSFKNQPDLPDELPLLAPGWDKCFLDLASQDYQLHRDCAPLKIIYVVDWASGNRCSPSITPMSAATAVPILAANTYCNELLSAEMRKQEFYFLSTVASTIKVKKLCPVDDMSTIPLVREMLLADIEKETMHGQFQPTVQAEGTTER
jgi:hypothetical protein